MCMSQTTPWHDKVLFFCVFVDFGVWLALWGVQFRTSVPTPLSNGFGSEGFVLCVQMVAAPGVRLCAEVFV